MEPCPEKSPEMLERELSQSLIGGIEQVLSAIQGAALSFSDSVSNGISGEISDVSRFVAETENIIFGHIQAEISQSQAIADRIQNRISDVLQLQMSDINRAVDSVGTIDPAIIRDLIPTVGQQAPSSITEPFYPTLPNISQFPDIPSDMPFPITGDDITGRMLSQEPLQPSGDFQDETESEEDTFIRSIDPEREGAIQGNGERAVERPIEEASEVQNRISSQVRQSKQNGQSVNKKPEEGPETCPT